MYLFIKRVLASVFIIVTLSNQVVAQSPKQYNAAEILLQIKKLNVLGSVLYIAAHPDDENTRLLAYLSNEKLYRTGYLSLTRGDGGQNLIGDEQGVELGMIRTQELLAARKIDGAEQFFSRAFDFGFSKNPDEALSIWDHEKILSDMVWVIRKFRPDVIVCRFPTTGEGGHGHHTASAILAKEAFDAAADTSQFAEQFKCGVSTWQAKRLLWNTFNFSGVNTQKETQFKIDAGGYNALLGKSYGEIASMSRSQHKSQGFGVPAQRGTSLEYFETIKGNSPVFDLLDEVNTNWSRENLSMVSDSINEVIRTYDIQHPENSLQKLVSLYKRLSNQGSFLWKNQKLKELQSIIEACSGLFMESVSNEEMVAQGDTLYLKNTINNRLGLPITSVVISYEGQKNEITFPAINNNLSIDQKIKIDTSFPISQPYWLVDKMDAGTFNVKSQFDIGEAENKPLEVSYFINIFGTVIEFKKPIVYKSTDPVKGEIYQFVKIVPPLSIVPEKSVVLSPQKSNKSIHLNVTGNSNTTISKLNFSNKSKTTSILIMPEDAVVNRNATKVLTGSIDSGLNSIEVKTENQSCSLEVKTIHYDHIPAIFYCKPASVLLKFTDVKIAEKSIGYIKGAGDKVPEMLSQMGYHVVMLDRKNITTNELKKYDAIVTGVRAYNTNEWMNDIYDVLMDFVKSGGVLLVQYNTSNNIGPLKAKIGPYPFTITRNRITDEKALINFINAKDPLLNYPNSITANDFEGWIQERSIYHAETDNTNYQRLFSMKDPGENEHDGSVIVANYGKGRFIYTGLVFFRELPAGVEGACRVMANFLAKPR